MLPKQLLAVCTPYVILALSAAALYHGAIEPRIAAQFHREKLQELRRHAKQIQSTLDLAQAQLRGIAQRPAFQSGDVQAAIAELKQLDPDVIGLFEGVYFNNLLLRVYAADGSQPSWTSTNRQDPIFEGQETVSTLEAGHAKKVPVIRLSAPVPNGSQGTIYAIVGEVAVTNLWPALEPADTPQAVSLFFSDGQNVLTSENVSQLFPSSRSSVYPPGLLENRWSGETIGLFGSPETPAWSSWAGVRYAIPATPWSIGYVVPRSHVFATARRLYSTLQWLTWLCLGIAAATVLLRHRAHVFRFAKLTEILQRFGASDRSARSMDRGADELGQLADAFNCMADDIVHSESKLQKRMAELEKSPLRDASATEALREKSSDQHRFAATAAHEFKGPLTTLQGFTAGLETAARSGDWGRFQQDVARIQRIGQQLSDTVDALLQLEKAESGQRTSETVSLHQTATEALELLRAPNGREQIPVSISPDLPTVSGHPALWRAVYQNLIQNALKACAGAAEARIDVGCERNGEQLACFVRDNGCGLDPSHVAQLFRADPCTSSGIGLRLVQRIVKLHGGKIWAERNGKSTTIKWTIGS